ncbi:LysR substrate-binding domain-containing protein [Piscinibacter sp.]|jgi:LysR family glycine cleavage system transcriptional activator|uniref:LysR substrate-binding domain-containing protein n=1 Tax=Piscinibacter sp. TaxID=1903157 RepID=UPI00355A2E1E
MRELPPLNALRVFDVTARCQSFSQAAQQLYLTQGAVSRQIQTLEQFFGFALFVRHPRKDLSLTHEGEMLVPVVRECFRSLQEVTQRLTQRATGLSLKIPTCAMRWVLPKIMRFRAVQPDIDIQITTTLSHRVDFDCEPFDAAIVYGEHAATGHGERVTLFAEVLTPACAPALLVERPLLRPDDLAGHTLLHPTRDHADWRRWLDAAGASDVSAERGQNFETMDLAMDAAVHGFGVTVGDCLLMSDDVAAGRLVRPFDLALPTGQHYDLVLPTRSAPGAKVAKFRDWLVEHLAATGAAPAPAATPVKTTPTQQEKAA